MRQRSETLLVLLVTVVVVCCFVCLQGDERATVPTQREFNGEC